MPFDDQSMPELHAKIKKGVVEYPGHLSADCKHLLSRILVINPLKRATMSEIKSHPWVAKGFEPIENHVPQREPLRHPLDRAVIRGMSGFDFGSEEEIYEELSAIIDSNDYQVMFGISHSTDDLKRISRDFYRRLSGSQARPDMEDLAYHPLVSIYYLVREKYEAEKKSVSEATSAPAYTESVLSSSPSSFAPSPMMQIPARVATSRHRSATNGEAEIAKAMHNLDMGTHPPAVLQQQQQQQPPNSTDSSSILRKFSFRRFRDTAGDSHLSPPQSQAVLPDSKQPTVTGEIVSAAAVGRSKTTSGVEYHRKLDRLKPHPPNNNVPIQHEQPSSASSRSATINGRKAYGHARHISAIETSSAGHTLPLPTADKRPQSQETTSPPGIKQVSLKGLFSVSTTSTKSVAEIMLNLRQVLMQLGITFQEARDGFTCVRQPSIDLDALTSPMSAQNPQIPPLVLSPPTNTTLQSPPSLVERTRRKLSFHQFQFSERLHSGSDGSNDSLAEAASSTTATPMVAPDSSNDPQNEGIQRSLILYFEVHVSKIPLLNLHGIQFKRVGGDGVSYKAVCTQILKELSL